MRPAETTIAAIAWDVDGTLLDSEPLHLRALKATCRAHDVDMSDLDDDAFVGVSLHGVWEAIGTRFPVSLDRDGFIAEINAHYRAHCRDIPVDGAVRALIERLAATGLRQVAVSNSNRAVVDANLALLGITDLLEFSLSLDDVAAGKPDPAPYLLAAERLGLCPSRIVAVEDSRSGLASARAAGCHAVGLSTTPQGIDGLDGADVVVGRLDAIPELLDRARRSGVPVGQCE